MHFSYACMILHVVNFLKFEPKLGHSSLHTRINQNMLVIFQAESRNATNESILKVALDHGKASGLLKPHDRVVVCQKVGDASVVKIIELEN